MNRPDATELAMFPLGTVLLPGVVIPLHVFEERYRTMVATCLEGSRELGVTLIERGSEVGGGDVRSSVGCIAAIAQASHLPDGRYALVCVGTRRIRVERWLDDDPYPRALVSEWPDDEPGPEHRAHLERTTAELRRVLALAAELDEHVAPATTELSDDPTLATWQVAALAPLGPADRQRLLEIGGPDERLALLDELLSDELDTLALRLELGTDPD